MRVGGSVFPLFVFQPHGHFAFVSNVRALADATNNSAVENVLKMAGKSLETVASAIQIYFEFNRTLLLDIP